MILLFICLFSYKRHQNQPRRHNDINNHPRLPAQRDLRDGLKQQHQSRKYDHKGNVLPLILVVGKDGKAHQRNVPEELVKAIRHREDAY